MFLLCRILPYAFALASAHLPAGFRELSVLSSAAFVLPVLRFTRFAAAVLKIRLREGGAFAFVPHPFAAPLPPMNIRACGRVFARRAHRNIFMLVLGIFSAFIGLCRFPSRQGERRVRRTFKPPSL